MPFYRTSHQINSNAIQSLASIREATVCLVCINTLRLFRSSPSPSIRKLQATSSTVTLLCHENVLFESLHSVLSSYCLHYSSLETPFLFVCPFCTNCLEIKPMICHSAITSKLYLSCILPVFFAVLHYLASHWRLTYGYCAQSDRPLVHSASASSVYSLSSFISFCEP